MPLEEFKRRVPIAYRGKFVLEYIGLQRRLPRNFSEMSFLEILENYRRAEVAIGTIFSLSQGQFLSCMTCDGGESSIKETLDGLVQYKEDAQNYLNSLINKQ